MKSIATFMVCNKLLLGSVFFLFLGLLLMAIVAIVYFDFVTIYGNNFFLCFPFFSVFIVVC